MNKKVFATFIATFLISNHAFALDLDMTVDDEIRKNYNSNKLIKDTKVDFVEENLPSLPEISKFDTPSTSSSMPENSVTKPSALEKIPESGVNEGVNSGNVISSSLKGNLKIPEGTSIDVISSAKVSDWLGKGNTIKFYNPKPLIKKNFIIPANTVFCGEVLESHSPQISGNGGLVVIRIRKMNYNGQTVSVNAYITRADGKMIFLNNIKGDRTYLKTMWKKGNWGRTLFNKMLTMTINLGAEGSTVLLSPFPFAYGTICLGLNAISSPITAFFSKGGHVSIPAGSSFRIKLLEEVNF